MGKLQKGQRNSNLELLRIFAMVLIIAHHFAFHGFNNVDFVVSNSNNYIIYFLTVFGKVGVDLFIILSAYFMVNSKFTFKKFLIVGGEVYFYSILFLVLFSYVLTPIKPISGESWFSSILPISQSAYWFITDYLVLMLFSPFLNKFIHNISKKNYLNVLGISLILWCIYPTFLGGSCFDFNSIIWFIILYLIGGFIRLHVDIEKITNKGLALLTIIAGIVCYGTYAGSATLALVRHSDKWADFSKLLYGQNSVFILIVAIAVFLIFLKRKEFSNKFINYIAGSVLGVYLIHENMFFRPYLWKGILKLSAHYNSHHFLLFAIGSIILVFIFATLADIVRRLTVEKVWIHILDWKLEGVISFFNRIFNACFEKLNNYFS